MKKLLCLLLVLTIIASLFVSIQVMADTNEVNMNFDDITSFEKGKDYIIGGSGYSGKITITNEKDHTTGKGKSIKMADRGDATHRIKFLNAIPKELLNKKVSVSVYLMTDIDTKLSVGAFSDTGTIHAYEPYKLVAVDLKANTWTKVELNFDYKLDIVTQIGIAQDKGALGSPLAKNIYIDDLCVKEFTGTVASDKKDDAAVSLPKKNQNLESIYYDFENVDSFEENVDYIKGGAYPGVPKILSEKDHTTGNGKSVRMSGRKSQQHRLKFVDTITPPMLNKEITASAWVYTDVDTKISIGAYGTVNTPYAIKPFKSKTYDVKKDTWTHISVTFIYNNETVTQVGIGQEEAKDVAVPDTIYIDDLKVGFDGAFASAPEGSRKENILTFDDMQSVNEVRIEGGGGAGPKNFELSSEYFYGGVGEGKSLLFNERTFTYYRAKFLSVFDGLSQKKGTKYNISMMVRIHDNARIEAGQFTIGIVNFLGTVGNGKEYYYDKNYRYTVKKGEWTKVEMQYVSTGEPVYGVTIDQVQITEGIAHDEYVVTDIFIDDVTVTVSDKDVPKQPILSNAELKKLANIGIEVYINNKRISFLNDVKPQIIDSRTLVPMRKIFESLGAYINWDDSTKTVTAKRSDKEIKLTIGSNTAYIDGKAATLDVPAQIIDSRTMVPVRFIAEALGCEVNWDDKKQRVTVKDGNIKNEVNIYKDDLKQEIYGFGAAANHNAWYLMKASEEMQQKALKALYDVNEGIGLNIVRLEVNPYTPNDKSNFNPEFQWTISPQKDVWDMDADVHQIWYMKEALKIDPDLKVLAVPWSAPAWMKENKSVVGKTDEPNELADENYDYYADYLARWVKHYNDTLGFDVKWLSIQNEPNVNTTYASTQFSADKLLKLTKLVTKKFKDEGIKTLVGGPEHSNTSGTNSYMNRWEILDSDFVKNELEMIVTHSYGSNDTTLDATNLERYNKPMLQTEKCTSVQQKREFTNELLMSYSNEIMDHLNHNYNGWLYWYGIRKTDNLGTQNSESLLDFSDTTKQMQMAREYYALGQFSKFIRPGYKRVTSYSLNPDIKVTSAINPENGKIVTVIINNGKEDITIDITGLSASSASLYRSGEGEDIAKLDDIAISNGKANITFKAQTITTVVEN